MNRRFEILPDPSLLALKSAFAQRKQQVLQRIDSGNFHSLCPALVADVLNGALARIGADEGSLWLLAPGKTHLVVVWNSGPDSARIVGFQQPLQEGLIPTVILTEQPLIENEVFRNAQHDQTLNEKMVQKTLAMIALPFHVLGLCHGVVTGVKLLDLRNCGDEPLPVEAEARSFGPADLDELYQAAQLASRLLDLELIGRITGWHHS